MLAESVSVETISITPKNIASGDKEKTAKGLSEILGLDYDTVLEKTKKNTAVNTKKTQNTASDKRNPPNSGCVPKYGADRSEAPPFSGAYGGRRVCRSLFFIENASCSPLFTA